MRGDLAGIAELRANDVAGTFRLVYTVRFEEAIYVLHAFQKKSPRGHEMARKDVRLIKDRLRHAQRHHESLRTSRDGSDR